MYKKILLWLMIASIFMDDFIIGGSSNVTRAKMPFDIYYYYLFFVLIILFFVSKFKSILPYPRYFIIIISLLFIGGVFGSLIMGLLGASFFKQVFGILFSAGAYYATIKIADNNIKSLFNKYLILSFIVAFIGCIQEVFLIFGYHNYFSNVKKVSLGFYRVYSIMGEPYFLAVALAPALYYYFNVLFGPKTIRNFNNYNIVAFGTIFLCFVFTFSTGGFLGLGLMIVLLLYNRLKSKIYFFAPLLVLIIYAKWESLNLDFYEVQVRIEDTLKGILAGKEISNEELSEMNSSSFALISNLIIAQRTLTISPFFGCGLGNHEHVSNAVFETIFGKDFLIRFGNFNAKDANSLFIRLMSEGGILGLILLVFVIFKPFVLIKGIRNPQTAYYTIINQGVFIMIIVRVVRTGNYISQGFFFFLFLYVITYLEIKKFKNLDEQPLLPQ